MLDTEAFRHFEQQAHDRIAPSYQTFFEPVTQHAIAALLDTAHVRAGTRLLDVATGPGGVAARAAARGAVVSGVDLAPGMMALAAQRSPQMDFRVADVEFLPFPEASFDAVVCNFGVGHFPRPEQALAECVRVLVRGWQAEFSWWDVPARTRIQGVLIEALQEAGAVPPPTCQPVRRCFVLQTRPPLLLCCALPGCRMWPYRDRPSYTGSRLPRPSGPVPWGAWRVRRPSSWRRVTPCSSTFAVCLSAS